MSNRVMVKEPPREGDPAQARYHLKDNWELIGWTNDVAVANDWLRGFGPVTTSCISDQRSWVTQV